MSSWALFDIMGWFSLVIVIVVVFFCCCSELKLIHWFYFSFLNKLNMFILCDCWEDIQGCFCIIAIDLIIAYYGYLIAWPEKPNI